jgi:hypothetical protein
MEAYYAAVRDLATDNNVRLVTYFLARHRRHQEMATSSASPDAIRRLRKAKPAENVPVDIIGHFSIPAADPRIITGRELLEAALHYNSQLLTVYRALLRQSLPDDAAAVVEALISIEDRDILMLRKMLTIHYF